MKLVVPDASVLLKWVLPEEGEPWVGEALRLRDDFETGRADLLVPSLWYYEAGNVLALHYAESAADRLAVLVGLRLSVAEPNEMWRVKTLDLAKTHGVTFYDASYHALAILHNGVFITSDEKYLRKVSAAGYALHLKDWPLI
jgi:predicted nucleic acid-binding protein